MKTHHVGIIGFGFMGKVHAYSYLNLPLYYDPVPLDVKITHVCDADAATAERGAATVGAAHAVTDWREVTENPEIDIVEICTPNFLHKEALLSAMSAGKHVNVDKPLVVDMSEAAEIEAALVDYAGVGHVELQNRFYPATLRAKQMIDEGFLGKPLEFRASYLHAGSANPEAPLKWKLSSEAGGGVIADLASHIMDVVYFLLGDYDRMLAETHIAYADRPSVEDPSKRVKVDAEDSVMLLARMTSGALGSIGATKLATGSEDELRFEIHGSQGALRFNGMDAHHLYAYDARSGDKPVGGNRGWTAIDAGQRYPKPASGFPGPKFAIGWIRAHAACVAHFLQCIADGKPGAPDLRDGIYVQRLMQAARDSAARGAWVNV